MQVLNLRQFTNWWWKAGQPYKIPEDPVKICKNSMEFVLFRVGRFQVEQITLVPGVEVPPHCHPNVDTYETHLCGSGIAFLGNNSYPLNYSYAHDPKNRFHLRRLRIKPGVIHSGKADTMVVALSFQEWMDCVSPTHITDNWVGQEWE